MLEKRRHSGTAYFDSYYIYDTKNHKFVGIIEDHCRGVAQRYFVGWKFEGNQYIPNGHRQGKTKCFDSYEEALNYIQEEFEL